MAVTSADAAKAIKLVVLLNDVSLREFAPTEVKAGFGFITGKPSTSFAPVAVTLDELGDAWRDERLHLPVRVSWNGAPFGRPDAGEMQHSFADLVARAAQTRRLTAGTIVGSGTVSSAAYEEVGSGCIQERRAIETIATGKPVTPFMRFGDRVRIEVLDRAGESIFGAIDQRVVEYRS
jgi:fumarylacetoacetate (FAA) hydrolase